MSELVTDSPQIAANDLVMAKDIADTLHTKYPGHLWAVAVDGKTTGFADIRNLALSGNWGFRIRLDTVFSASEFKLRVMRAGGELLDRYRLTTGKLNLDHLSALPTDFAGRLKADKG